AEQRRVPRQHPELTLGGAGHDHVGGAGPDLFLDGHQLDVQLRHADSPCLRRCAEFIQRGDGHCSCGRKLCSSLGGFGLKASWTPTTAPAVVNVQDRAKDKGGRTYSFISSWAFF